MFPVHIYKSTYLGQTVLEKDETIKTLSSGGHTTLGATTQLWCCTMKAVTNKCETVQWFIYGH